MMLCRVESRLVEGASCVVVVNDIVLNLRVTKISLHMNEMGLCWVGVA